MRRALALSAALHVMVGCVLLVRVVGRAMPIEVRPVEVELVKQARAVKGAPAAPASAPADATAATPPPPPAGDQQAAAPSVPEQGQPAAPVSVRIGNADRDLDALWVTGQNVLPPAPDAAFRNRPPAYPPQAAHAGEQGVVRLLIRVSPSGLPADVLIANSSGSGSLDRAARDAVLTWHFRPAQSPDGPVPYEYTMDIRFVLGGR